MRSHVYTSLHLSSAHSWRFGIHDSAINALGGYLSPYVLWYDDDPKVFMFCNLWVGNLQLIFLLLYKEGMGTTLSYLLVFYYLSLKQQFKENPFQCL